MGNRSHESPQRDAVNLSAPTPGSFGIARRKKRQTNCCGQGVTNLIDKSCSTLSKGNLRCTERGIWGMPSKCPVAPPRAAFLATCDL
eukprot:scaffold2436_cov249-Pinguiococcus_pyrenoidosus.AAC.3